MTYRVRYGRLLHTQRIRETRMDGPLTITVRDLIVLLADWSPDTPVRLATPDGDGHLAGYVEYEGDTLYLPVMENHT